LIIDRMAKLIQRHEEMIKVITTKRRKVALERLIRMSLDKDAPYSRKCNEMTDDCPNMKDRTKYTREKRKYRGTRPQQEETETYRKEQSSLEKRKE